ncbi:MAG: hypothetical protein H3Z52_11935 [archaeon]|nr:hypothetical protein [archaeon]MCP8321630.1 hypothetical protein [archaeon]
MNPRRPKPEDLKSILEQINWSDFEKWIREDHNSYYAKDMFDYAKKFHYLLFSNEFVEMPNSKRKVNILNALNNLTLYLDVKLDTDLHESFLTWVRKKRIKWSVGKKPDMYNLAQRTKPQDVIIKLSELVEPNKTFGAFALMTGLRAEEVVPAFNNHEKLCQDGIMELFWDRGTKKANAVYCHPLIHKKLSESGSKMEKWKLFKAFNSKIMGFRFNVLRKINYTLNVKIEPLLAEFMQGRTGNVSMKHYFLPLLENNKQRWLEIWNPIIERILS